MTISDTQHRHILVIALMAIVDYISIVAGSLMAYHLRLSLPIGNTVTFDFDPIYVYFIIPFIFIATLGLNNSYQLESPYWDKVKVLFRSITIGTIVAIVLMYTGHITDEVSRLFVAFAYIFILILINVLRFLLLKALHVFGLVHIPVLLIGAGKTAELVQKSFDRMPVAYYKIIGYIDDHPKSELIASRYPKLGGFQDIENVIKSRDIQTVLICVPGMESKDLVAMVNRLQLLVKRVAFVPELFGLPMGHISARALLEEQTLILRIQNNLAKASNRLAKRIFDVVATVLGGLLILPFVAIIALLIYLDSPGPVVYKQQRIGKGGKEFSFYKFRSMVVNAEHAIEDYLDKHPEAREEWERNFKLKNDPRVTRIGKFIRKTSLDELPQLWNVLKGDMSLVGPRPLLPNELERYGTHIEDYGLVPPGLTGVWQVSGRSDTTFEDRVLMDSWYIHNWSIWIDIVYLAKTVIVVLKGKGAY